MADKLGVAGALRARVSRRATRTRQSGALRALQSGALRGTRQSGALRALQSGAQSGAREQLAFLGVLGSVQYSVDVYEFMLF